MIVDGDEYKDHYRSCYGGTILTFLLMVPLNLVCLFMVMFDDEAGAYKESTKVEHNATTMDNLGHNNPPPNQA